MLCTKNLENSGNSETDQITQYIKLGPPSWLTPTPQYVAHVSYLTTHKAPPETPCSTPLIRIRRPEWLVLTRGWRFQVFICITQETKKPSINQKNWNVQGETRFRPSWNQPPQKWVPNTSPLILPLGPPVDHN